MDGDSDVDVLYASAIRRSPGQDTIGWFENIDSDGTFGPARIITAQGDKARSIYPADMDGDGDVDVLYALNARKDDKIVWFENIDGRGTFGPQRVISTDVHGVNSVYAADIDGDRDVDVLSASAVQQSVGIGGHFVDARIAWYENTDGRGTFGGQQIISTRLEGTSRVLAGDVDGDGDDDVLDESSWYENIDGKGTFGSPKAITVTNTADVDGDGDVDLVSGGPNEIAWYENTDAHGTFDDHNFISFDPNGFHPVYPADVDGDGDIDVLYGLYSANDEIGWYENIDGKGTFVPEDPLVITRDVRKVWSLYSADFDGDGDVDVLSASIADGKIAWHENLSVPPPRQKAGDANGDGLFNQLDLVQVLVAAKYQTGQPASFEEGDWNGDGVFDKFDVLAALVADNYLEGNPADSIIGAIDG
jgi:hypothetical protein